MAPRRAARRENGSCTVPPAKRSGEPPMDVHELSMTALRAVAVYFVMLLVIRVSGKRAIGNFTAFDLLVALMLGEVVDEMIYGDVTMAQGLIAIVVVTALQYL